MTDRHRFAAGRATKNGVTHFPAQVRVEYDRSPPDPDDRPSDRIVPGTPDAEMETTLEHSVAIETARNGVRTVVRDMAYGAGWDIGPMSLDRLTDALIGAMQHLAAAEADKVTKSVRELLEQTRAIERALTVLANGGAA